LLTKGRGGANEDIIEKEKYDEKRETFFGGCFPNRKISYLVW